MVDMFENMDLTKKQTDAVFRIVRKCESNPIHKNKAGEFCVDDGFMLTDGNVLLHAPYKFGVKPRLPMEHVDELKNRAYMKHAICAAYKDGDFYRVDDPFSLYCVASTLRKKLGAYAVVKDGHEIIKLSAFDEFNRRKVEAWFDVRNIINAFEAVGKDAVGYIGSTPSFFCGRTYLIVEPYGHLGDLSYGIHALVLPMLI